VEDLEGLDRFGRKSAENLHRAIEKSRRRPLERIIAALGIPQVGWTTAIELAPWLVAEVGDVPPGPGWLTRAGERLREIATDGPERFAEVEGVGPTVSMALRPSSGPMDRGGRPHRSRQAGVGLSCRPPVREPSAPEGPWPARPSW
jgi:hypothetical protein